MHHQLNDPIFSERYAPAGWTTMTDVFPREDIFACFIFPSWLLFPECLFTHWICTKQLCYFDADLLPGKKCQVENALYILQ